jgi:MFS family permease
MASLPLNSGTATPQSKLHFGWVVVAACTLIIALSYGVLYSYSVFFKPLADHFNWDRGTVSLIYSALLLIRGAIAIGIGWLADRYGHIKISVLCGILIGLGLILSSQVQALWQFFVTYAIIEAAGLSGAFGIGTSIVSHWFTKNRGLALGIVSTGSGLGTIFIVPATERLVNAFDWSTSFIICGAVVGVLTIAASFFLRTKPDSSTLAGDSQPEGMKDQSSVPLKEVTLIEALRNRQMLLFMSAFFLFFFCLQIVMVHLVNFATDTGIEPLVAASFISIIGAVSIAGRLLSAVGSDRMGINNILIYNGFIMVIAFVLLLFTRSIWAFYLFAVVFGFTYGGEVPQTPLFIGKLFGTRTMATLVGLVLFIGNIGGALGPWLAGVIFDNTNSYQWAFIIGTAAAALFLCLVILLKKQNRAEGN